FRFRQPAPGRQCCFRITIAARLSFAVEELAIGSHGVDPAARAREIRDASLLSLVDLTEEFPCGILAMRLHLEVQSDRNEVVLDDLRQIVVPQEPGPGSNAGPSGPPQRMPVADPDEDRLALGGGLLPGLP